MMRDDERCPCRSLSPGLYSVERGCARHDDGKGATHFACICYLNKAPAISKLPCLACEENARRGLGASGLADGARGPAKEAA